VKRGGGLERSLGDKENQESLSDRGLLISVSVVQPARMTDLLQWSIDR